MWKYIGKVLLDLVFVIVLYLVSYTNRDSNAGLQVNHLRRFFLNTRSLSANFPGVCRCFYLYEKSYQCFFFSIDHLGRSILEMVTS